MEKHCNNCHGNLNFFNGICEKYENNSIYYYLNKNLSGIYDDQHFNQNLSDILPLNRNIPDSRPNICKENAYMDNLLPNTSVIFVFYNEHLSTLIRSIITILERTSNKLLHEIILIDDCSSNTYLKEPLDLFVASDKTNKIKLIRLKERTGLIKARVIGARLATSDTITFLDSHIEVNNGWLEPMLQSVKENPKLIVFPYIASIKGHNLNYKNTYRENIGKFRFDLVFTWGKPANKTIQGEPILSPTMPGGLYLINRQYFIDMGEYDLEMQIYGGENLEISMRIWQCGGKIAMHPCSHIGHIFRTRTPYVIKHWTSRNLARAGRPWMDEYFHIFLSYKKNINLNDLNNFIGNIDDRINIRNKYQCKDFKWYINNVLPLSRGFIKERWNSIIASGYIQNKESGYCIQIINPSYIDNDISTLKEPLALYMSKHCNGLRDQLFIINEKLAEVAIPLIIGSGQQISCLTKNNNELQVINCQEYNNYDMEYYVEPNLLLNSWIIKNKDNQCVTHLSNEIVGLKPCNYKDPLQNWQFQHIYQYGKKYWDEFIDDVFKDVINDDNIDQNNENQDQQDYSFSSSSIFN